MKENIILTDNIIKHIAFYASDKAIKVYQQKLKAQYEELYNGRIKETKYLLEIYRNLAAQDHPAIDKIDEALYKYKKICLSSGKNYMQRRWRVIEKRYLIPTEKTIKSIAQSEYVASRTIDYDLEAAYKDLTGIFFGIIDVLEEVKNMTFKKFVEDLSQEEVKELEPLIIEDIHSNTPQVKIAVKNALRKLETTTKVENKMKRE